MLQVEHISSGYGKKQVLFDVSFEVNKGEVLLLTGGNGSGKSTVLKCIYNLLPLWSGAIFFDGERIDGLKPSDMIRKGIAYIPQKDFCFENLTVEENLKIAGNILPKKILKQKIDKVYEETGLIKFRKRKPFNLSGGEKKLLAFGMGMVHEPKLLLFDEPISGIDVVNYDKLFNVLKSFKNKNNIGILMVEHKVCIDSLINKNIYIELGYCIKLNTL